MQVNGAYNIRQTGNGIGSFIPKNSQPSYVGATVAWNQLAPLDASGWSLARASFSVSGTTITIEPNVTYTNILKWAAIKINPLHKYFIRCKITAPTQSVFVGIWNDSSSNTYTIRTNAAAGETANVETIWDATANGNYFRIQMPTAAVTGDTGSVDKLVFTDLTLAFGSTIADYAYTLESGNAGDGVAWLKAQGFFKEDYYAYDAGSLQNVETEKAINTGIDPTNIHTYTLGHATLRGLPKLDTNNNIYYDGDTYESSGKITRRFKVVHLGDQNWSYNSSYTYPYFVFSTGSSGAALIANQITVVCTRYEARTNTSSTNFRTNDNDKKICVQSSSSASNRIIQVQDSAYTDATAFKNSLNGVYLIYQAVSETTESAASFESLMFAEAGGTEQLVDYAFNHGTRDVEIPVGAVIDYGVIRYAGYLVAVRNSQNVFTPIPLEYMRYESYNVAPDQRLDLDTTRDTTGVLHRTVLAHTATKVTFNVPSMPAWRIQELFDYFRTAFKQTNGDTQAHKLELKYYDEWEDEYKTGIMYMPDITFQIRNIDGRTINYSETKVTFIEY